MDVLHFLKTHHDSIRDAFVRLTAQDGVKARRTLLDEVSRDIEVHLTLEKDYLYPEIAGLFPGSEAIVTNGLANASVISKRLKMLMKLASKPAAEQDGFGKCLSSLHESLLSHFDHEEQMLMPKVRATIRTEDREDLGQVFIDVKADALAASAPVAAETAAATGARGRKRA